MHSVKFEDALNMTGFGKCNFIMQFLNTLLLMGLTFEIYSVSYLVPASACDLNTTNFEQGLIAGIPLLGMTLTSHLGGYLADTKGRRLVLLWCLGLGFLFGALSSLSPDWITLGVLKFCSACAVAGAFGLSVTLVSECTPKYRRTTMIALTSATFITWAGVMAVICIPVLQLKFSYHIPYLNIDFTGWRLLALIYASASALGGFGLYFAPESPKYLLSVGEEKKAIEILKTIYTINTGKSRDDYNVGSLTLDEDKGKPTSMLGLWSSVVSQTLPLLRPPLLKDTLLLTLIFSLFYFGIFPFFTWLPFTTDSIIKSLELGKTNLSLCDMLTFGYTESLSKSDDCSFNSLAMYAVLAITIVLAVINVIMSAVVNYIGNKRMLIIVLAWRNLATHFPFFLFQLISGTSGICVGLTSSWLLGSVFLIIFMAGLANFGFLSTFCIEVFPTYLKAMGVLLTLMIGRVGSVLGINILKYLLVNNCELAFYIYGGSIVVCGLVAFTLSSDVTDKKIPSTPHT